MKKKGRATMEAVERSHPHQSRSSSGGAGDFFICFSARPSSSSLTSTISTTKRVPSTKALMSPGRGRDPSSAPALSASLSRRLRSSGSVKGGQSPMFPSGVPLAGRKKGCSFEAAEPSSPKVTCIGQVRVKAKKKVKSTKMARSRSQRARECCPGRNQSWVHQLPLSICEALRGIGSEFSCFVPCGGRAAKEKGVAETRMVKSASSSSCGAVMAKWLLAVQENEEDVKRGETVEVGFLVREREEKVDIEEVGNMGGDKGDILVLGDNGEGGEEAAAARVSVCIPPRNALLLMRCRSDPVKMAALANRFWGSPVTKPLCEEAQVEEEKIEVDEEIEKHDSKHKIEEDGEKPLLDQEKGDAVKFSGVPAEAVGCKKTTEEENRVIDEEQQLIEETCIAGEKELSCGSAVLQLKPSEDEAKGVQNQEKKSVGNKSLGLTERKEEKAEGITRVMEERRFGTAISSRSKERGRRRGKEKDTKRHSFSSELDARRHSFSSERETKRASFSFDRGRRWSFSLEKADLEPNDHIQSLAFSAKEAYPEEKEVTPEEVRETAGEAESDELVTAEEKHEAEEEKKGEVAECTELPDCLLMMMYEPKLSMEVSKETWVCGNDFLRWRPQNPRNRMPAKPPTVDDNNAAPPPPENEAPEVAATVVLVAPLPDPVKSPAVQHKLSARQAAVAPYEPLVLTRCKSEPVRSSARLAPDACFWKERHRPIGAAGIGF
ncbi:uncharacterized protein LOC110021191 [Phalaenopsis equestris]|uniref:uncharacterized protein LOC110021191 n=1 Tax=Phalaenopsis equestris TaxID=78828 RepID=UPI0009E63A3B|nr:uncharacterized protein LOC110021191 [Phalaenopsis equestris]